MDLSAAQIAQATISAWVLVDPLSRGVFFRSMTDGMSPAPRRKGAIHVVGAVAAILIVPLATPLIAVTLLTALGGFLLTNSESPAAWAPRAHQTVRLLPRGAAP